MYQITITYAIEWQLSEMPHYKVTKCGKIINAKTGKILKRTINNRCTGYWIGKRFYSLEALRQKLERIPKQTTPF
jgi:hypothetical protein